MCLEAPNTIALRTTLEPRGPAAAVILTDEQVAAVGGCAKTPPVRVTVNGHTFAGRIVRRNGEALLGFNRAVRETCGVEAGDEIDVRIALDDEPREVELPEDLTAALRDDPAARASFEALSFTKRKELARRVAEAKRPETRERRLGEALAALR